MYHLYLSGYGYLAPKTQTGRGICILYTCIGLPLNLIFMACVGRNLARLIGVFYSKLQRLGRWIISLRKLGLKQHTGKLNTCEPHSQKKSIEMSKTIKDAGCKQIQEKVVVTGPTEVDGSTNYSAQYLQWPGRDADTRSLSQQSEVSAMSRSPSRTTLADPVIEKKMKHPHYHDESAPDVPILFLLFLIAGYCGIGAWVMIRKNDLWTFLDGVYFWFITITTVGFGDLEITRDKNAGVDESTVLIQISIISFVVVGLALMSACVTLCIERGHQYRRATQRLMCNAVDISNDVN